MPRGTPGTDESERPLTPEGRKKTAQAARGLRRLNLGFDALYTSPLLRAVQTAEILAEVLELRGPKPLDLLRAGTPSRKFLAGLTELGPKAPLLVGHEPMFSTAVSLAVFGSASGLVELKKAGLALLEIEKGAPRLRATLTLLLTPSALRKLGS